MPTNITAVIFDMDGVLVDSEPFWQIAELQTLNTFGLTLQLHDMEQTIGLRIDQVVDYWYQQFPWDNYDNTDTANHIVQGVVAQINLHGKPMVGVIEALEHCKKLGLKIGLATSSSTEIIKAVFTKLNIEHYFDFVASAELLAYGKPHPEVYLNCAKGLNTPPSQCVAIEDSFNGLIAARAATMQTIAIPAPEAAQQTKWVIAHQQLADATQLIQVLNQLNQQ